MTHRLTHPLFAGLFALALLLAALPGRAEDGYEMWLRYLPINNTSLQKTYRQQFTHIVLDTSSPTLQAASEELSLGLSGLLEREISSQAKVGRRGALVLGTAENSALIAQLNLEERLQALGPEGFIIEKARIAGKTVTVIAAQKDTGVLYGAFHLLRLLQTHTDVSSIAVSSAPKVQHRVVNHWDNLNRLVERGYAGLSLWDWGTLPQWKLNPRYRDYARINASLGINGTVINNVNADARILRPDFLEKTAALAEVFRPYGIKTYISINYNSPVMLGDLDTADPLDPKVQQWWKERAKLIYQYIPDFGGFLVKANSEGQPGPLDYGRNHAEGANMLARALEPHGGLVFWRAFVYNPEQDDRFREAYDEFKPLDGEFMDNVIVQIKNGPIDFQPREPFSPLFGALKKTNMALELQVTQEYFGFSYHLAYQGPLFAEVFEADTYAEGEGSTIGSILAGEVYDYTHTGIAGVINPGTDRNWTGHPFVQSSWYAFGRMAWDYTLSSESIAEEWLRMTFNNHTNLLEALMPVMEVSREAGVNYRDPLGLTHLYAQGHHYGPAPWLEKSGRPDWTAFYYHGASKEGIGFDRTASGSNAIEQYHEPLRTQFADPATTPEDLLLWFHHLPWDYKMQSGRTLWQELAHKYHQGVEQVRFMQEQWQTMETLVDPERFEQVKALLEIQLRDAIYWRDACLRYFSEVSGRALPEGIPEPAHDLDFYRKDEKQRYIPDPWHPASSGH